VIREQVADEDTSEALQEIETTVRAIEKHLSGRWREKTGNTVQ
jgi:hypothetical protein